MALKTVQERRKAPRVEFQGRAEVEVPKLQSPLAANSLNFSEGGACMRLQEALDVRSSITIRLFVQPRGKPLECEGRVAWVIQRLDLRNTPPFLYDVGVEFIDPSSRLRQFASRIGLTLRPSSELSALSSVAGRRSTWSALQPALINGRRYEPRLTQEQSPDNRWHLIVTVDGVPCFSHRYPLERKALESWKQFKRQAILSASRTTR